MTTWTIIGGGLHAVTIAIKLRSLGLKASQLSIIDPNPNLCAQFDNFKTYRHALFTFTMCTSCSS